MKAAFSGTRILLVAGVVALACSVHAAAGDDATGDYDGNGYLNRFDALALLTCLSGPGAVPTEPCRMAMDMTEDELVDLVDFASLQRSFGHLPIPLRDELGAVILIGGGKPYSGRTTCGGCHDLRVITNGFHFEQGRTDTQGHVIIQDDYFDDGRFWERSPGRYGRWSQAVARQISAKESDNESLMDSSPFQWIRSCSGCHPGGGPGEFDRDNQRLYDAATGQFGYEGLGKTADDVRLDGDYALVNQATGEVGPAPWDVTGVSSLDCLTCHRTERTWANGVDMNRTWRAGVLAAGPDLTDFEGNPVPAFASAGTAGQGWFSGIEINTPTPKLQIDYSVGIADGSIVSGSLGEAMLSPASLTAPPVDRACMGCHRDFGGAVGVTWFDERDVHYRKLNQRSDDDPANDISDDKSRACNFCHPGNPEHNFAKGHSLQLQFRNDLDYVGFRSCRDCHLDSSPIRHPDAPMVPGTVMAHLVPPFEILACQTCHIPYALSSALVYIDPTMGDVGRTSQYLSADPLDPKGPDKSKWYPSLKKKLDTDGVERWFPYNAWLTVYWADWDQNDTPEDFGDDKFAPIIQWRLRQAIGNGPLPIVTDDNGDGRKEINRPEEILAYMQALKSNDRYGRPVAKNPVLVKGKWLWYADALSPTGVSAIEHEQTGLPTRWEAYTWDMNHNVLKKENAWGRGEGAEGCRECHAADSPVFDRKILVDPYGPDGQPVYETVRQLTGLNPP